MRFATIFASLAAVASAAPVKRGMVTNPTFSDGFMTPTPAQLAMIEKQAHGTLSNGSAPPSLPAEVATALQLVALNERFESVFFQQLYHNVSTNVSGFEVPDHVDRQYVLEFLRIVQKTEELHTLDSEGALAAFNQTVIQPCTSYNFPVSNFQEAITLAATFTANVFGVIGDIATTMGQTGAYGLIDHVVQIVAAEAEQVGFFRYLVNRTPQELPFTTPSTQAFAFTALHGFIDAASCPNINAINLTLYETLSIVGTQTAQDCNVTYILDNSNSKWMDGTTYYAAYTNQLNAPVVLPVTTLSNDGSTVSVEALFPYTEHMMNGLTVVAITNSAGPFAGIRDVAAAAVWAPGLIYIN